MLPGVPHPPPRNGLRLPCFFPLNAFRRVGGGVSFSPRDSGLPLQLPCGQCQGCRFERSRQWALRCVHEAQLHRENSFVTLTYDGDHLPSDGGLHVSDWQRFAKRLRKVAGPFRFFHCGEYGEKNKRPHYHACIFGLSFGSDRIYVRGEGHNRLYTSGLLSRTWGMGHCSVGELTYESAAYVARYVMKKMTGPEGRVEYERVDPRTGEVFDVAPPYVTMSRRPGVGALWFDRFKSDVFPSDEVVHLGRRFRPPRFYDGKLPEVELEAVKAKRVARVAARKDELTPERLSVRAECAAARLSRSRRDL